MAWLSQRSTQLNQVSLTGASRGLTAGIPDRRSASDLESAIARRRDWLGTPSPPTDPSATGHVEGTLPTDTATPSVAEHLIPGDGSDADVPQASLHEERTRDTIVRDALRSRGVRYRWGGTSRHGFDCSGFTRYLMARTLGINLPHSASGQAHYGRHVRLAELQEGDLVFFRTYRRGISHVGVYVGENRFIHAPRTGRSVAVETLTGYYLRRFVTARRLAGASPPS